jgi:hypothetical protein
MSKRICIAASGRLRRWHVWLAEALRRRGKHRVSLIRIEGRDPLPLALAHVIAIEKIVYRIPAECALDVVTRSEIEAVRFPDAEAAGAVYDIVIAIGGAKSRLPKARQTLVPFFDAAPSELGALSAILEDRELRFGVLDQANAASSLSYLAVSDQPVVYSMTFNAMCARMVDLLGLLADDAALPRPGATKIGPATAGTIVGVTPAAIVSLAVSSLVARLRARLTALASGGERWAIGTRIVTGEAPSSRPFAIAHRYQLLKADGRRQYADPFAIQHAGRSYIFCEEFPLATGKGVISVFAGQADMSFAQAETVLEEKHHLSYPMIFEDQGRIWMIPESGACGSVILYRCEEFPHRWAREAILLDGIVASDPTLHKDERGYWLFLTTTERFGSPSDRLSVYHARKLQGPWKPCGGQPTAIDPASSRPAGHMFRHGNSLYRPAQDCSRSYGGAVVICKVEELTATTYAEVPVSRIAPGPTGPLRGAHTFNRCGRLEVVDVFGCPQGPEVELIHTSVQSAPGTSGLAAHRELCARFQQPIPGARDL